MVQINIKILNIFFSPQYDLYVQNMLNSQINIHPNNLDGCISCDVKQNLLNSIPIKFSVPSCGCFNMLFISFDSRIMCHDIPKSASHHNMLLLKNANIE